MKFCKVWTVVQGYLTIASYISIHGACISTITECAA